MLNKILKMKKRDIIELLKISINGHEGNICELITLEELPKLTKKQIYNRLENWYVGG